MQHGPVYSTLQGNDFFKLERKTDDEKCDMFFLIYYHELRSVSLLSDMHMSSDIFQDFPGGAVCENA